MICKNCGTDLLDGTSITRCPKCGASLAAMTPPNEVFANVPDNINTKTPPSDIKIFKPEESSGTGKILLAIILLVVAAGLSFFLFTHKSAVNNQDNHNELNSSNQTPVREEEVTDASDSARKQIDSEVIIHADNLSDSRTGSLFKEGIEYFNKGNYQKARESFEAALAESPSDTVVRENLANTMYQIARQEIANKNYDVSIKLFENALVYNPFLHVARKGIGIAFLELNEVNKAAPYIDAYIESNPSDSRNKDILFSIADAFFKNGDRAKAQIYFEKLLSIDPYNNEAKRKLAALKVENKVEQGFQTKEGSHFTVKFEGGENSDIGYLISIILEEAYIKVGSDTGYYPEDRIEAVLYSRQQFTDVTRAPAWAGAIYDGRIKIPAGGITNRTNLLEKVLFHEYTHAVVHRLSKGRAPVWLNEGLAQHEEDAMNEDIDQILTSVAKAEKPISLRYLEGSFMGFNGRQAAVAYSISLSATKYIINEYGISAVRNILERLGNGENLNSAVSNSLHISYAELDAAWMRNLKNRYR